MAKTIHRWEYRFLLDLLLRAREASGLAQGDVAAALGHAQSTLSNLERGSRRLDIVEMIDYCHVIGADPRKILDALLKAIEGQGAQRRRPKRARRS